MEKQCTVSTKVGHLFRSIFGQFRTISCKRATKDLLSAVHSFKAPLKIGEKKCLWMKGRIEIALMKILNFGRTFWATPTGFHKMLIELSQTRDD